MSAPRHASSFLLLLALAVGAGCGPATPVEGPDAGGENPPPVPAVTTLSPEPGPFNGQVTVTLTTDVPAEIHLVTERSEPGMIISRRHTFQGTVELTLNHTTTLKYFSVTADGATEAPRTATFIRAGAEKGTISGVVVVNTLALGHPAALFVGGQRHDLGQSGTAAELPFTLTGLPSGRHRLRAVSDQNDDGNFLPLLELSSAPLDVDLDLDDPFRASAENVRILLGAPASGLCAMTGVITHPRPRAGETLRISALDPGAFGGGLDPTALLGQLQEGFLILVDPQRTEYPYVLNDLEPGSYIPVPMLTTLGNGGLGVNLQANPLSPVSCAADKVAKKDLALGPVGLTGAVTLQPQTPPSGFVYGVVAAKNVSFTQGLQAVLMPGVYTPNGDGDLVGGFGGRGLRANTLFGLRAFSNAGGGAGNPLLEALMWAVTPLGGAPAHATLETTTEDATVDFTVQLP
jgi:hypothetical protein